MTHPLFLFQSLLHDEMDEVGIQQAEEWLKEFPYFALPYFLIAKQNRTKESLFRASIMAPNRSLLKGFMDGSLFVRERELGRFLEDELDEKELRLSAKENNLYSIVDFDSVRPEVSSDPLPFKVWEQKSRKVMDEYINLDLKIRTYKCLGLVAEIDKQLGILSENENSKEGLITEISTNKFPDPGELLKQLLENRPQELLPEENIMIPIPDESALSSIQSGDDLISETLAKLHWRQGRSGQAIEMYEKLKLKFPEKSAYFDAQIQKIQGIRWQ